MPAPFQLATFKAGAPPAVVKLPPTTSAPLEISSIVATDPNPACSHQHRVAPTLSRSIPRYGSPRPCRHGRTGRRRRPPTLPKTASVVTGAIYACAKGGPRRPIPQHDEALRRTPGKIECSASDDVSIGQDGERIDGTRQAIAYRDPTVSYSPCDMLRRDRSGGRELPADDDVSVRGDRHRVDPVVKASSQGSPCQPIGRLSGNALRRRAANVGEHSAREGIAAGRRDERVGRWALVLAGSSLCPIPSRTRTARPNGQSSTPETHLRC